MSEFLMQHIVWIWWVRLLQSAAQKQWLFLPFFNLCLHFSLLHFLKCIRNKMSENYSAIQQTSYKTGKVAHNNQQSTMKQEHFRKSLTHLRQQWCATKDLGGELLQRTFFVKPQSNKQNVCPQAWDNKSCLLRMIFF